MTNHPRSPRAKFRVGQVVAVRNSKHQAGPKFFRVSAHSYGFGMVFYGDGENPQYRQELLRPLTKKEAGYRVSGTAVKHCGGEIKPCDIGGDCPSGWLHVAGNNHYCDLGDAFNANKATPAPKPNEPTLTCSEVVERLHNECVKTLNNGELYAGFDTRKAELILHEWRERRVQELEELLAKHSGCSRCTDSASGTTSANDSTEIRRGK